MGQSVGDLSLTEVLDVAFERTAVLTDESIAQNYSSSSWLAALPSVSVAYLDSDQKDGTDEREVSLNLPIKSSTQRRSDDKLNELAQEYDLVSIQRRKLYLSGLIREAIWSYEVAQVQLESAIGKNEVLQRLENRYKTLFAANVVSEYSLLLLQKELVDTLVEQRGLERTVKRWEGQFRAITGLGSFPKNVDEVSAEPQEFILEQHPLLRLLKLDWLQTQWILLAASNQSASWDVSITAKNIRSGSFEEDQYGIGIEVPLSFINIATQSHNSEWMRASRQFDIARDELQLSLQRRWEGLHDDAELLLKKEKLLIHAAQLSKRIAERATQLRDSNELAEELFLRQMIESIDSQAAVKLNRTQTQQNNAMLRQAAGIIL